MPRKPLTHSVAKHARVEGVGWAFHPTPRGLAGESGVRGSALRFGFELSALRPEGPLILESLILKKGITLLSYENRFNELSALQVELSGPASQALSKQLTTES